MREESGLLGGGRRGGIEKEKELVVEESISCTRARSCVIMCAASATISERSEALRADSSTWT